MRKIKFEVGKIYHIYNRGVEKRNIFIDDSDKWRFLQGMFLFNNEDSSSRILFQLERENKGKINFILLKDFIYKNRENGKPLVKIVADCLMPNHFHLLVEEIQEGGISKFMHKFGTGYVKYFNKKYSRTGPLFQGRFKAVLIDNDIQLQYILAYINVINPGQLIEPDLKEKGVIDIDKVMNFAESYSFSTNPDYLGIRDSIIIDKEVFNGFFPTLESYKNFIKDVLISKKYNQIKEFMLD